MFDYLPEVRRGEPITAAMWNTMVRAIRKRTPQAGFGLTSTIGDGGITFSVIPMSEIFGESHPWLTKIDKTTGDIEVTAGTFQGLTPANLTGLTVAGSGTSYLVLTIAATLDDRNDYVYSYTFDSCSLSIESTDPGGVGLKTDAATGEFLIRIATITDRSVTSYAYKTNLTAACVDDGTENSQANLLVAG